MALLCLKVPAETARIFSEIKVPGEPEPTTNLHVSLIYLGKELELQQVLLAIQVTYQVLASWTPFLLTTRWVTTFDPSPEGIVPVIARVESAELHDLQAALREAFDEEGVEYSKKWPDFKPHVTLSYVPEKEAPKDFTTRPIQWACNDVVLWAGDEGANDIVCNFPLSIQGKAASEGKFAALGKQTRDHQLRPYVKTAMWNERYASSRPKSRM